MTAPVAVAGILLLGGQRVESAFQSAAGPQASTSIEDETRGMSHMEGFFDLFWDEATGKLFWEIDRLDEEFLYQVSLASGLGSNPVGLDRGQLGGTYVLKVHRVGPSVLLFEPNYRYRARSDNPEEVRAVEDAFAPSIHWAFPIVAESDGRVLVDATDFFLRDAQGIVHALEDSHQGAFQLEKTRSVIRLPGTKAFPHNTEVETTLTFTSSRPGPLVRSVAASGEAITLRQHHSLVKLPGDGYRPRELDPRIGALGPTFYDYAVPIDEQLAVQFVARHRLQKRDPSASRSEAVEPIVYYLDRGVPEPVRSALIEGASWWSEAFEAAGFIDAFRVELLPEDADPLDVRYNVIFWTHRSTRGWSYGSTVVDPRTGEILRGVVNLGSLRLRQDYLIGQGLGPPHAQGLGGCGLSAAPGFEYLAQATLAADPVHMALARVRQLSAHEVGHTLGFPHNYIASTYGRASVMDYPAPLVHITEDGDLDLSDAYGVGIGEYDKLAVRWLYGEYAPETDEQRALESIVREGLDRGLRFMAHPDNAFVGAAHPLASVWDNGEDLVETLAHEIEVRRIALERFGESAIPRGEPLSSLEKVLVPLYLHHRFQLNAAAQTLGGADYSYALRGDGQTAFRIVPGARQRRALEVILQTLTPEFLTLPERIASLIPPPAYRAPQGETFEGHTGLTFDPLAAVASSAQFTVSALLHPERMARLVEYHAWGSSYPGLDEVLDGLIEVTWKTPPPQDRYGGEVQHTAQRVVLDELLRRASDGENIASVRAILTEKLLELAEWLESRPAPSSHDKLAAADIRRWEGRPYSPEIPGRAPEVPPGSPIGSHR